MYTSIQEYTSIAGSGLHWYCVQCDVGINALLADMSKVKFEQNGMRDALEKMTADMELVKKEVGVEVRRKEKKKAMKEWGWDRMKGEVDLLKMMNGDTKKELGTRHRDEKKN